MATVMRRLLVVALAALLFDAAVGADITVGSPNGGWDMSTNLMAWAQSQTFNVGDNLIFAYQSGAHDVVEVNKAGYDSCSSSNPISTKTGGNDRFALEAPGTRYFICGIPGHCLSGMKVQINVAGGAGSSPATPTTPPSDPSTPIPMVPPTAPSTPTNPSAPTPSGSTPPPPPKSAAQGSGLNGYFRSGLGAATLIAVCALI